MTMTKYKKGMSLAVLLALLSACGGGGGSDGGSTGSDDSGDQGETWTPIEPEAPLPGNPDAIPYASYPIPQTEEVPVTASLMIKFDDSVYEQDAILDDIGLVKDLGGENQQTVTTEITLADRGRTVIVTPVQNLDPLARYSLQRGFTDDEDPSGYAYDYYYYSFTTAGNPDGTQEARSYDMDEMTLEVILPKNPSFVSAIQQEKIVGWSVIRLVHTQPVDPETVRYGDGAEDNFSITRDDTDELIDANIFVEGRNIIVDPIEELEFDPGHPINYLGDEDSGIKSIYEMTYTPLGESTRSIFTTATEPGWEANIDGMNYSLPAEIDAEFADPKQNSPWTDRWLNELAGNPDAALEVDLATVPGTWYSAELYHFRIRKESLSGGNIDPIPRDLGPGRGEVEVTYPTDLTGYIVPTSDGILARLYVYMNISLNGAEPQFQAVEMAGYANINSVSGDLTIDAVGAIDPAAIGQERAPGNGMLAFRFVVPNAASQ